MIIKGVVDYIVYPKTDNNANNGFIVFKLKYEDQTTNKSKCITVVGYSASVSIGMNVEVKGIITQHEKYGEQIKAESIKISLPTNKENVEKLLINNVRGIGKITAHKIYEEFGQNTLKVLRNNPERLMEINMGHKKAGDIIKNINKFFYEKDNVIMLQEKLGLSSKLANKIYSKYKDSKIDDIIADPYRLIESIDGIGFKKADEIAKNIGFDKNSDHRIKEGIIFCLQDAMKYGHVYLPKNELIRKAISLLGLSKDKYKEIELIIDNNYEIINDNNRIYLKYAYFTEGKIAYDLKRIEQSDCVDNTIVNELLDKNIRDLEKNLNIMFASQQKSAIKLAITNKVSIITGGPGTGKTTITKAIINLYKNLYNKEVLLASPTGRAAKRLSEATNIEAQTIHRLLECSGNGKGNMYFNKNENNKLSGGLLLIDESSMIDIFLMTNLLKAIPDHMKLVLIGDIDQLPSVGPGNVLKSIIESNEMPVARLEKIYRQEKDSLIVVNSHRINRGKSIVDNKEGNYKKDFVYIKCKDDIEIEEKIISIIESKLQKFNNIDIIKDLQILTPMKRGVVGLNNLNKKIQDILNGKATNKREINYCGTLFREQDKVMQIGNNYSKNIFNGDCGFIKKIDPIKKHISVRYDDINGYRDIEYIENEIKEIVPSYAMTIHKSQGNEFPIVIIPICRNHTILLQKNLLYTALTRAKKLAIIVGEEKSLNFCIKNNRIQKRNTNLHNILNEIYINKSKQNLNLI